MENKIIAEPQIILPPPSISQKPKRRFSLWFIVVIILICLLLMTGGLLFFYFNQPQKTSTSVITENDNKVKKIIAVQPSNEGTAHAFYTYDLNSKEKNIFLRIEKGVEVNEVRVSPDGEKLYYISTTYSPNRHQEVTVVDKQYTSKKVDFAGDDNLWYLSASRAHMGGDINDCYWSPNSTKIVCSLIKQEKPAYMGAGRVKISVYDLATGSVSDILTNELISPPDSLLDLFKVAGWIGDNKILIVQEKEALRGYDEPADFYSVDINTKSFVKEFSYPCHENAKIAITPNGKLIFFQSFNLNENKFIKYDLDLKQDTIIFSTKDMFSGVIRPIISEDGSKVVYSTSGLKQSLEETNRLFLEGQSMPMYSEIHVNSLLTNEETKINLQDSINFIEALLPDGKTFIINKTLYYSLVYNLGTKIMDIGGSYVGLGSF